MLDRNNKYQLYSIERAIIPERLKDARIYRGYSQQELADKVDVTRQAISSYEKGKKNPSIEVLTNISMELKFPFDFFYKHVEEQEVEPVYFFRSMSIPKKTKEMLYKKME
jgi:transcriptional regulator with XRE-family HTH domain